MSDCESPNLSSSSINEDQSQKEDSDMHITEDTQTVEFNLTDPEDVETKLENLTDEEMEQLLKQAYKINNELKRELSRKEREQSATSSTSSTHSAMVRSSDKAMQLPPIRNSRERRGFTPLGPKSQTNPLYASPVSSSRQKARTAVRQPTKIKPEWNDRFGV